MMLNSQYKNIVQWTICYGQIPENCDSVSATRKIFDNLGVAFPQGNLSGITQILKSKTFMGWRPCSLKHAKRFANLGVTTIAVSEENVLIILPDKAVENFSDDPKMQEAKSQHIVDADSLPDTDEGATLYFAYNYGYTFDD